MKQTTHLSASRRSLVLALALMAACGAALCLPKVPTAQAINTCPGAPSASIQLIAPNGGQTLQPGATYDITWSATGAENVSIALSLDNGESWLLPYQEPASAVISHWSVPDYYTEQGLIRVEALNSCGQVAASDQSDAVFTINGTPLPDPATESLEITNPSAGAAVSEQVILEAYADEPIDDLTFYLDGGDLPEPLAVSAVSDLSGLGWSATWDSRAVGNGEYSLTAKAERAGTEPVTTEPTAFTVDNVVLPEIEVSLTAPVSGSGVRDMVQLIAVTDQAPEALDFVVRPKAQSSSAETAVVYGLTSGPSLTWTTLFDTRKYPDGAYYIKAKAYLSAQVVGESQEVEVLFDNPDTTEISVAINAPSPGATVSGQSALSAWTSTKVDALDFVVTEDASAGGETEPIIVAATGDLAQRKWTALWNTLGTDNADYGVKAKAYMNGQLVGESALQSLTVYNKPVLVAVDLLAPLQNDTLTGDFTLLARTGEAVDSLDFLISATDAQADAPPVTLAATPSNGKTDWSAVWLTDYELDGRYRIKARAVYGGQTVGESLVATVRVANQKPMIEIGAHLSLAESNAPETDPNAEGEYGAQSALSATPTIALNRGLSAPEGIIYAMAPGTLFKTAASTAVYYYGQDGKRYVFPDGRTYASWYGGFGNVKEVSAAMVAEIPLGGLVGYRPGARMVKIQSDPKVYAVARGGVLRWVKNEVVARRLYGTDWNQKIDDISDAFFFNYTIGPPIED